MYIITSDIRAGTCISVSNNLKGTAGPVYGNPSSAPYIGTTELFLVVVFVAFSRLRTCFCARNIPYSVARVLSTLFFSRTPFQYFSRIYCEVTLCMPSALSLRKKNLLSPIVPYTYFSVFNHICRHVILFFCQSCK